eukprot:1195000-Prorocentrum_minimum.AAC.5
MRAGLHPGDGCHPLPAARLAAVQAGVRHELHRHHRGRVRGRPHLQQTKQNKILNRSGARLQQHGLVAGEAVVVVDGRQQERLLAKLEKRHARRPAVALDTAVGRLHAPRPHHHAELRPLRGHPVQEHRRRPRTGLVDHELRPVRAVVVVHHFEVPEREKGWRKRDRVSSSRLPMRAHRGRNARLGSRVRDDVGR